MARVAQFAYPLGNKPEIVPVRECIRREGDGESEFVQRPGDSAVDGLSYLDKEFLKRMEALKAEKQTQKRSCADTRTSQEARRIDLGDVDYTTNDVPGGPWGGVLRGTGEGDALAGENGEDEVYGLVATTRWKAEPATISSTADLAGTIWTETEGPATMI